jgi:hypothetical protein
LLGRGALTAGRASGPHDCIPCLAFQPIGLTDFRFRCASDQDGFFKVAVVDAVRVANSFGLRLSVASGYPLAAAAARRNHVCRALVTLNSRASDDCLAYSVLFRLVVITNMELAWSASLGRVMTVIVQPSD